MFHLSYAKLYMANNRNTYAYNQTVQARNVRAKFGTWDCHESIDFIFNRQFEILADIRMFDSKRQEK
jgi:hypothetical protein